MRVVITALFLISNAAAFGLPTETVTTQAISPGMDTVAIEQLAKRSTERELQRLTPKTEGSLEARTEAAAQDKAVVRKIHSALLSRLDKQDSDTKALLKQSPGKLTVEQRRKLISVYLAQRTRQTTDLLTKLAYGNDEVRDWLSQAKSGELDEAVDIFQNPHSAQYQKLMKRIGQQNASVARKIRKQVGQAHLMSEPVLAGVPGIALPSAGDVAKAEAARKQEAPAPAK